MVRVSVIIPVYNVEKYLERCLKSVVEQSLKDIEIIVVNDGSTDGSGAICEKFAKSDNRIKIINQKNKGIGSARNTGMKSASGEYIGFVDSDDWIDSDFFEKLYDTAQEYGADIAYADFIRKGKYKHKIRMGIREKKVSVDIYDKMKHCRNLTLGCVWNKIYKRDLIESNGLSFPEGRLFEDGIFSMQAIYYANRTVSVPDTYYYYFVNPTSIVKSQKTQKKTDDVILCQHDILNFMRQKGIELEAGEFLTVTYKLKVLFLTLLVIKEDLFLKKFYLFGSIPFLNLQKSTGTRILGEFLGLKFVWRKRRLTPSAIKKINKLYESGKMLMPAVLSAEDTLNVLESTGKSICRFGDGEFNILLGESISFQKQSSKLANRLRHILVSSSENVLVAIPDIFGNLDSFTNDSEKRFWRKYLAYNRAEIYSHLDFKKTYYDSMISRVYMKNPEHERAEEMFNRFKNIWRDKNVVFVEGEATRLGVGNDLFSGAKSVRRILCPPKNAFSSYEKIFDTCLELPCDSLFILALGPSATVLAYDLAISGRRALDLGHLDVEYEWFLMGAKKKLPLKNKYVNEARGGKCVVEIKDSNYLSEVYRKI